MDNCRRIYIVITDTFISRLFRKVTYLTRTGFNTLEPTAAFVSIAKVRHNIVTFSWYVFPFLPVKFVLTELSVQCCLDTRQMESSTTNDAEQIHQQVDIGHKSNHSPISRCPLDVLMCIFETMLLTEDDEFAISMTISHVCRRWRQVALNMPRLWSEIGFSCTAPVDRIQSYLDRIIPRVKARPINVWIDHIDYDDEALDLHVFRLDRISVINSLMLELYGEDSMAHHLMNPTHAFRGCLIEGLYLSFPIEDDYYERWDCMELLDYFPSVFSLSLYQAGSANLNYTRSSTQLRTLLIQDMEAPFLPILWSFPHLEELEFKLLSFSTDGETDDHPPTVMTHLKELDMVETTYSVEMLDSWLRQVSCPVLSSLHIERTMVHAWIPFISSHRSILYLEECELGIINELIKVAPQLQTLVIDPQDEATIPNTLLGDNIHAFTKLKNLFLYDVRPEVVTLERFEEFVRARCLPSHHPESQRPDFLEPLETLRFGIEEFNADDRVWMTSELYKQAQKDVETSAWTHITLSWI